MDEIKMKRDNLGLDEQRLNKANKEKGEMNLPKSVREKMRTRGECSVRLLTPREQRRFMERERKREERRNARKK